MKTSHNNIALISQYLQNNPIDNLIITEELVKKIYDECIEPSFPVDYLNSTKKSIRGGIEIQYDFIVRDLVKLKFIENGNRASGIQDGYVYCIDNQEAFPGYVKIGSTIDVFDRLNSYQTYSPKRNFRLLKYFYSPDRLREEREMISMFEADGEWVKTEPETITNLFRERELSRKIRYPRDKYENFRITHELMCCDERYSGLRNESGVVELFSNCHQFLYSAFDKRTQKRCYDTNTKRNWVQRNNKNILKWENWKLGLKISRVVSQIPVISILDSFHGDSTLLPSIIK